ncbi:L-ascorbate oxidase-like protein [Senna tora]|uniref:L-ascorbate oxidase-like protein n=1 Tax=Senna tora TaxID=362788 RepID=A0A834T6T3_9FABA|nr:L-ascorbate oxidase-like protein [Senna tora]
MNVGVDFTSGMSWSLRSWENEEDPSPGVFSLEVEEDDNYIYEKLIVMIKMGNTVWKQGYLTCKGNILLDWQGEFVLADNRFVKLCVRYSDEEERMMISKETDGWNINYYTDKLATPLLDTINYHPHIKNLSSQFNVLVGDWYTKSYTSLKKLLDSSRSFGMPNGVLINGKTAKGDGKDEVVYTIKAWKIYKNRFCNVGIKNSINVRFQNHPMKLVELEGSHTVQNKYDSLDIHVGQCSTILVTANKEHKDSTSWLPHASTNPPSLNEGKLRYTLNGVSHVDPETPLKLEEYYGVGDKVFNYNLMSDEPPSNLKNLNIKDHK